MSRLINILPENVASKIAAGEVIQRPASAVKELLENSIDAGAKNIAVVIKQAGKTLIQVIDDGSGMSAEDAAVAFQRHATSKISSLDDLENIRTLGFRGEALASIAAISQVELNTRRAGDDVGTKIRIEGGLKLAISETSTTVGTNILVKNLFYNTPARRKFLKSDQTEFKHIFDVIQRVALAHPELSISFVSDDEQILKLRPSTPFERVREIFGEKLAATLFEFNEQSEFVSVGGFLGKPDFARKGKMEQYLFLNTRHIVNRSINHAVFQGYENLLEKGSFPFFILFVTIDPRKVDVNVHPSKMEVKFDDESMMYRFVLHAVRRALSAHDLIPEAGMREEAIVKSDSDFRLTTSPSFSTQRVASWEKLFQKDTSEETVITQNAEHRISNIEHRGSNVEHPTPSIPDLPLWQIHNKYILVPTDEGVLIIDQHAAHERVLYERAVIRFNETNTQSQQLLFPHTLEMTAGDAALVRQLQPLFEELGFSLKIFGKTTVIVDGVPIDVKPGQEKNILQDILDVFKEDEQKIKLEPREWLAKSYSCKAAVKAGDPLSDVEMRSLLDQLFATEIPYVCPHGRPVMIKLSLSELDKRFGRTS
jgi:DNA mismatch repair protein MutL